MTPAGYLSTTEPFDAVLSCGVLEHVEDPDASLDEIRRVLQPGGTFYVYKLPNRASYLEAIARRLGSTTTGCSSTTSCMTGARRASCSSAMALSSKRSG